MTQKETTQKETIKETPPKPKKPFKMNHGGTLTLNGIIKPKKEE